MQAAVLIVDDEAGLRELLKRWLSLEYLALEAGNAEKALEVLAQSPQIKVVLADLDMPGKGGAWLVSEMRRRFPSTVVVLATADDTVPGTLSLQPNVVGYLVKPLNRDRVLQLVATGVQQAEAQADRGRDSTITDPIESFLNRKLTRGDHGDDHK